MKYSSESRTGISLHGVKTRKADWIGHILCMNRLLKHVTEGRRKKWREDEEEDVTNYWMTLRKRQNNVN